jgi:hypothetical protein
VAELGVNGFGHFDRNQSGSAAGPKPGIDFIRSNHSSQWNNASEYSENYLKPL